MTVHLLCGFIFVVISSIGCGASLNNLAIFHLYCPFIVSQFHQLREGGFNQRLGTIVTLQNIIPQFNKKHTVALVTYYYSFDNFPYQSKA